MREIDSSGSILSKVFDEAEQALSIVGPNGEAAATSDNQLTEIGILMSLDDKVPDLNTTPVKTIQIFTLPFDAITASYPSSTQEVYQSRVGGISGTVQQTVTINYTDASKASILNVART